MFNLNSVLFSSAAAAETVTDKTEINNVNLRDELKQDVVSMDQSIPRTGENARELGISVISDLHGHEVCSLSASSYTDSLEADELSQTGSDITGTESEKCAKKRRSRLPIMKRLSDTPDITNNNCLKSYSQQNGSPHHQSLPESPYGTRYIARSQSVTELYSGRPRTAKDTITSRMRFDKHHSDHDHLSTSEEYATPTQRKDQMIKSLKKQIKQIEQVKAASGQEEQSLLELKEAEIKQLKEDLATTQAKCEELTNSYEESVKSLNTLEETLAQLRESISQEKSKHELLYLEMYRKGQESARFERDEELEMLATSSKHTKVSVKEVVRKLSRTQSELARWQSLRREEIYAEADKPETEADTILRFLKDSFIHYVTDGKDSDDHLRAIVRIFHYSDIQKKKIELAQKSRKNGKH
ncbi:uncharacterized protein LOC121377363 [Gigantopelta aegis]|uniref:uncharacterized protein LOC121377363 n=1 Tax=Gigantopelta aegis TaxID=1735272 RepID=UPI001B888CC0|nr:uncharacterized protein LOC121377363 [Gigantopelta aegis]